MHVDIPHGLALGFLILQNDRDGSLFQSTYKAKHIENDRYLKYLFEYIHLNPLRKSLEEGQLIHTDLLPILIENPNTSLRVYAGKEKGRIAEAVLDQSDFRTLFSSFADHTKRLLQWNESNYKPNFEGGLASLKRRV